MTRRTLAALLIVLVVTACAPAGGAPSPSSGQSAAASVGPSAAAGDCTSTPSGRALAPPEATPLAEPPPEPAGDGTLVTLCTDLGNIVIEMFTESSPVAAENFVNLAAAGFYDGIIFHRVIPGFVIQGGDPEGTGGGGPGYTILDDAVVGEYERGNVAMARPANRDGSVVPDSQGSQFFIILDDLRERLPKDGRYAIFGRVTQGMDVVDAIASGPTDAGDRPLAPVVIDIAAVRRP